MHSVKQFLLCIAACFFTIPSQAIRPSTMQFDTIPRMQVASAALAFIYSNIYIHELGHKYTAKWLTGADSTISLGLLSGYTHFDDANWKIVNKKPKAMILALLAGPIAGFLAGLGVYAAAALIDKNTPWHDEIKGNGRGLMLMNLINLIPFWWGNFESDGYRIWDIFTKLQRGEYEKSETASALSISTSSISEQFNRLKKTIADKTKLITDQRTAIFSA